jgi:hypothetical protein
MIDDYFT